MADYRFAYRWPPRPCEECRAEFWPRSPAHRFCSSTCRYRHRYETTDRTERGHVPAGTVIARRCAHCGLEFTFPLVRRPRMYCSPGCRARKDVTADVV